MRNAEWKTADAAPGLHSAFRIHHSAFRHRTVALPVFTSRVTVRVTSPAVTVIVPPAPAVPYRSNVTLDTAGPPAAGARVATTAADWYGVLLRSTTYVCPGRSGSVAFVSV